MGELVGRVRAERPEQPSWADFQTVWSVKTPNALAHIVADFFPGNDLSGSTFQSRCKRSLPAADMILTNHTNAALDVPVFRGHRWCDRCMRTMDRG